MIVNGGQNARQLWSKWLSTVVEMVVGNGQSDDQNGLQQWLKW